MVSTDPGGYVMQPETAANPPAQVVIVNPPAQVSNPWAQPTAFRPPTDQFIGPELHPANKYSMSMGNVSQYAPQTVAPSGVPQYHTAPVQTPTATVSANQYDPNTAN